jgi:hypothetical protein
MEVSRHVLIVAIPSPEGTPALLASVKLLVSQGSKHFQVSRHLGNGFLPNYMWVGREVSMGIRRYFVLVQVNLLVGSRYVCRLRI